MSGYFINKFVVKELDNEFQVYPAEFENQRIINARKILHFPKTYFKTIIDVRCYCREYLSIENIKEVK